MMIPRTVGEKLQEDNATSQAVLMHGDNYFLSDNFKGLYKLLKKQAMQDDPKRAVKLYIRQFEGCKHSVPNTLKAFKADGAEVTAFQQGTVRNCAISIMIGAAEHKELVSGIGPRGPTLQGTIITRCTAHKFTCLSPEGQCKCSATPWRPPRVLRQQGKAKPGKANKNKKKQTGKKPQQVGLKIVTK